MTTLTNIGSALKISANLENRILHDWNNGGTKSTYGLDVGQRKKLIRILLLENPKCNCLECIQAPAPMSVVADIINLLNKKERRSLMNLEEYREHILANRRESTVSVVAAIINSTKKEGSK